MANIYMYAFKQACVNVDAYVLRMRTNTLSNTGMPFIILLTGVDCAESVFMSRDHVLSYKWKQSFE